MGDFLQAEAYDESQREDLAIFDRHGGEQLIELTFAFARRVNVIREFLVTRVAVLHLGLLCRTNETGETLLADLPALEAQASSRVNTTVSRSKESTHPLIFFLRSA
jgi:hypothetical protein